MIIVRTPLRISLFGGGSDFPKYFDTNEAMVLTTAINKYTYAIIKERYDDHIRLGYSITENVQDVNDLKHELAREAIKRFEDIKGIEISTMADVAGGTGLGSSSAMTVGLLHALYAYCGELPSQQDLAEEAIDIEVNELHKPIGYQDQIIAAYGGFRSIHFLSHNFFCVNDVNISDDNLEALQNNLLLWNLDKIRDSADILGEQNARIADNARPLKEIVDIAKDAKKYLEESNIDVIGVLLDESWNIKKKLASRISNPDIDQLYEYAMANGASGGKVAGAGGGGFLLTYVPLDRQPWLRRKMAEYSIKELKFDFEKDGSKIIFDGR
jgi:D-glycero-alpha-D-manno-heptose-7-phosphate kinase